MEPWCQTWLIQQKLLANDRGIQFQPFKSRFTGKKSEKTCIFHHVIYCQRLRFYDFFHKNLLFFELNMVVKLAHSAENVIK